MLERRLRPVCNMTGADLVMRLNMRRMHQNSSVPTIFWNLMASGIYERRLADRLLPARRVALFGCAAACLHRLLWASLCCRRAVWCGQRSRARWHRGGCAAGHALREAAGPLLQPHLQSRGTRGAQVVTHPNGYQDSFQTPV